MYDLVFGASVDIGYKKCLVTIHKKQAPESHGSSDFFSLVLLNSVPHVTIKYSHRQELVKYCALRIIHFETFSAHATKSYLSGVGEEVF